MTQMLWFLSVGVMSAVVGFYGWNIGSNASCIVTHLVMPVVLASVATGLFHRLVSWRQLLLALSLCIVLGSGGLVGYAVLGEGLAYMLNDFETQLVLSASLLAKCAVGVAAWAAVALTRLVVGRLVRRGR